MLKNQKGSGLLWLIVVVAVFFVGLYIGRNGLEDEVKDIFSKENFFGTGKIISEEFELEEFSRVDFDVAGNLYISQGEEQLVKVDADEKIMEKLIVEVRDGTLRVSLKPLTISFVSVNVYVTIPDIDNLTINGSGSIIGETPLTTENLDLRINGSGYVELDLDVKELDSTIAGSGEMNLKGSTIRHSTNIEGSGDIKAAALATDSTSVNIEGSGSVKVVAEMDLDVNIEGSGDVEYSGKATVIQKISGSGSVIEK
ncbi:DUF2807 domain-containing protein [Candidatus Parcubacteria bacterium]|jgi:hypothetical protein|nr:DUF2807 domain-containing protein [Candidatus Parcubacteria bacterium]